MKSCFLFSPLPSLNKSDHSPSLTVKTITSPKIDLLVVLAASSSSLQQLHIHYIKEQRGYSLVCCVGQYDIRE
jgi:hypothetical protein